MTKKEICENNFPIATYSNGLWGIYIHSIKVDYDTDNSYVYCSEPGENPHYHRCKLKFTSDGRDYFTLFKSKIFLDECLRIEVH